MVIDDTLAPSDEEVKEKSARELKIGSDLEVAGRILDEDFAGAVFADGDLWRVVEGEKVWTKVAPALFAKSVERFDGAKYPGDGDKWKTYRISAAKQTSVYKTACNRASDPRFFELAPAGVAFKATFVGANGPEELTVDHRCRFAYDFEYVEKPEPERFFNFLIESFTQPDETEILDRAQCLGQFAGLCLLGRGTQFHKAVMLLGAGANGKSVFLDVLRDTMPPGSVACLAPQNMAKEQHLVSLAGKLCNIVPEIEEAEIIRSGEIKSAISGDPVTARGLYQDSLTFRPTAGHIFSANALPRSDDRSQGYWRRWVVIRFPNKVEESRRNPRLARELIAEERAHIASWFVQQGLEALKANALTVPKSCEFELAAWKEDTDQTVEFAVETIRPTTKAQKDWLTEQEVFEAYTQWCDASGHKRMLRKNLTKALENAGYSRVKQGGAQRISAEWSETEAARPHRFGVVQGGRR